jgi:hypothetical protein
VTADRARVVGQLIHQSIPRPRRTFVAVLVGVEHRNQRQGVDEDDVVHADGDMLDLGEDHAPALIVSPTRSPVCAALTVSFVQAPSRHITKPLDRLQVQGEGRRVMPPGHPVA